MYKNFLNWFSSKGEKIPQQIDNVEELALLTTALMIEVAKSDGIIHDKELQIIVNILISQFEISQDRANEIINDEIVKSENRIELHSIIQKLREKCNYEDRLVVLEYIWMIVLADENLDHLESNLMRRLSGLLFISDKDAGIISKKVKDTFKNLK